MSASCTTPRVMIAAGSSGSGKTTVVCGLLRALARRELDVIAYKCGPDYIDPMFHRSVLNTPCRNLDLFFSTEDEVRTLFGERSASSDIAVLEGVMGFYDGLGGTSTTGSAYHVARTADCPVVLVVDGRGVSLTIAATINGLAQFRPNAHIAGVIVNRCSKMTFALLKPIIERECGIKALGYLPNDPALALESRHLGLVTASELPDLQEKIDHAANLMEQTVDLDALLELAQTAPALDYEPTHATPLVSPSDAPVIAVAQDSAFCFYYEESLEFLRNLGARIVEFSPMKDASVPPEADALYLGGGYPELHVRELSENTSMLDSVRAAHAGGMPIFAECGGFLYLKERIADIEGNEYPLTGILPGNARYTGKLQRFGYIELTAQRDGLCVKAGETYRAHEFHYYDSSDNGTACHAVKPTSGRNWDCGVVEPHLFAGFPHFYLPACKPMAERFVQAAAEYHACHRSTR